jgi:hypothetical protein
LPRRVAGGHHPGVVPEVLRAQQLSPRFRAFATDRGLLELARFGSPVATKTTVAEIIAVSRAYFEAVMFDGYAQTIEGGSAGDALLYQHGGGATGANVTRQLLKKGKGIQLGVTLTFDPPPTGVVTLWSHRFPNLDAWQAAALEAAAKDGLAGSALSIRGHTDRF